MSTWQRVFGWLVTEIDRQPTVPPAGIIPGAPTLDDTPMSAELEHGARHRAALQLVAAVLEDERAKTPGFRNAERFDLALEMRSILHPAPAGAEVLREVPAVRHATPVREWTS
jgi:hypothetical protein